MTTDTDRLAALLRNDPLMHSPDISTCANCDALAARLTDAGVRVGDERLRDAAQTLCNAISAAEATGWTWAGGAEWVSLDDPAYRLPSEMQTAHAALASALAPKEPT